METLNRWILFWAILSARWPELPALKWHERLTFSEIADEMRTNVHGFCETPRCGRPELENALRYIQEKHTREISLQEVADVSSFSCNYFCKIFKQEIGAGFVEYLNTYRIKRACELLRAGGEKLYEIAWQVGFENYRHFCRVFRRVTGISPQQYAMGEREKRQWD